MQFSCKLHGNLSINKNFGLRMIQITIWAPQYWVKDIAVSIEAGLWGVPEVQDTGCKAAEQVSAHCLKGFFRYLKDWLLLKWHFRTLDFFFHKLEFPYQSVYVENALIDCCIVFRNIMALQRWSTYVKQNVKKNYCMAL